MNWRPIEESNPGPRVTKAWLKIKQAALEAWVANFGAANPGASFAVVLQNARQAHPHLRVTERPTRQAIAKLGMKLSVGNPEILRKKR